MPSAHRPLWRLDPNVVFLNHGSFGACPIPVLEAQARWRERLETEPVAFLGRELEGRLDEARSTLGTFIGADPAGIAFVRNATTGVGAVLGSLRFEPGDELLTTDHEYNAILNAVRRAAERDGARMVVARIPFPIRDPSEAVEPVLAAVTPRTRLAIVSHVTSATALVMPIEAIVESLVRRGIEVLVDGAHAPGQVPLDVGALGATYYAGNAHKWLCAPKGAGFLWVQPDRRDIIRPLVTSHGANDPRAGRSRYHREFDWAGTDDPTPYLTIPDAIRFMDTLDPDGWPGLMAANHRLAIDARDLLAGVFGWASPTPDTMLGSMASVPVRWLTGSPDLAADELSSALRHDDRIEVPISCWPVPAARPGGYADPPALHLVRISVQRYNEIDDYRRLADALGRQSALRGVSRDPVA
jgi:isopenicillin-N epimerase